MAKYIYILSKCELNLQGIIEDFFGFQNYTLSSLSLQQKSRKPPSLVGVCSVRVGFEKEDMPAIISLTKIKCKMTFF
jgi:hypothetical protein